MSTLERLQLYGAFALFIAAFVLPPSNPFRANWFGALFGIFACMVIAEGIGEAMGETRGRKSFWLGR